MDRLDGLLRRCLPVAAVRSRPPAPASTPALRTVRNAAFDTTPPTHDAAATSRCADPLRKFAVPAETGRLLVALCRQHRKALDPDYYLPLPRAQREAVDSFHERRTLLVRDAMDSKPACADQAVARTWPDPRQLRTQQDILKLLLRGSSGLVVGETHASKASKRLLIDHMRLLRTLGVDTLYLEHLQGDIHQADLDHLHATGALPAGLKQFLSEQDHGHMTDTVSGATFSRLVEAAARAGMRIVALDLMASYHLKGAADALGADEAPPGDLRTRVMNHVAVARIEHDQSQHQLTSQAPRRWVALVGNTHAGVFNGVSGIAERLEVPSVRVEDVHDANAPRLEAGVDPGLIVPPSALRAHGQLRCDYLLKVRSST